MSWLRKTAFSGVKPLRILGLDPGEKRIGVALSDPLALTAQGLTVIGYSNFEQVLEEIEKICREFAVDKIIVGKPLNMNGTAGKAAGRADLFAGRLRQRLNLPVLLHDERLTSFQAERTLIDGGLKRQKRRMVKDKLAAVIILQSYLDSDIKK